MFLEIEKENIPTLNSIGKDKILTPSILFIYNHFKRINRFIRALNLLFANFHLQSLTNCIKNKS
jgi:hypothetical protein